MNSTVKTVLIIGGVGVGVFLVLRALAPSQPPRTAARQTGNAVGSTILGLIPSAVSLIGNAFSSPPPVQSTSGGFIVSSAEQTNIDAYNAQPGEVFGVAGLDY